jgi:LPS-assembly protein
MTGYAFFDSPRRFSPVVSSLTAYPSPTTNIEWRSDYDPLRKRVTNSTFLFSWRKDSLFLTGGHNHVRANPNISPSANQFIGLIALGRSDRKGWSMGFQSVYDFRLSIMQFATTQITYNTDCCGLSVQYRRFSFGTRNENQFRVAFAVANIGSFGTLRRQERAF